MLLVKAIRPSSSSNFRPEDVQDHPLETEALCPSRPQDNSRGTWAVTLGSALVAGGWSSVLLYEQASPTRLLPQHPKSLQRCVRSEACVVAAVEGEERLEAGKPTGATWGLWHVTGARPAGPTRSVWPGNCSQPSRGTRMGIRKAEA